MVEGFPPFDGSISPLRWKHFPCHRGRISPGIVEGFQTSWRDFPGQRGRISPSWWKNFPSPAGIRCQNPPPRRITRAGQASLSRFLFLKVNKFDDCGRYGGRIFPVAPRGCQHGGKNSPHSWPTTRHYALPNKTTCLSHRNGGATEGKQPAGAPVDGAMVEEIPPKRADGGDGGRISPEQRPGW